MDASASRMCSRRPARRNRRRRPRPNPLPKLPPRHPATAPAPEAALAHLRGTKQKANRIRQITAKKTRESLQTTAQLTQTHEVDMTKIVALRARAKAKLRRARGRQPDLPAVHRQGGDRRAQDPPERQRELQRGQPRRSPTTTPSTSASRSTPSRACSPRSSTTPATCRWAGWPAPSPTSRRGPGRATSSPTSCPAARSPSPTSAARARCSTPRSWFRRRRRCWAPARSSSARG